MPTVCTMEQWDHACDTHDFVSATGFEGKGPLFNVRVQDANQLGRYNPHPQCCVDTIPRRGFERIPVVHHDQYATGGAFQPSSLLSEPRLSHPLQIISSLTWTDWRPVFRVHPQQHQPRSLPSEWVRPRRLSYALRNISGDVAVSSVRPHQVPYPARRLASRKSAGHALEFLRPYFPLRRLTRVIKTRFRITLFFLTTFQIYKKY